MQGFGAKWLLLALAALVMSYLIHRSGRAAALVASSTYVFNRFLTLSADTPADNKGRVSSLDPPEPALNAKEFRPFKLIRSELLTHDTKRYTFALPTDGQELGLKVASCLYVQGPSNLGKDGKAPTRPYTPTSPVKQRGTFNLIVKSYDQGVISKWLFSLPEGATVPMKGPGVKFEYTANQWDAVGLVAGGTGITPMYQLIQEILSNPRDRTQIRLLYASKTPDDIILKKELDALMAVHPNQFRVTYTVDSVPAGKDWRELIGFIDKAGLIDTMPPPQKSIGRHQILVCGPPKFMALVSGEKTKDGKQGELSGLLRDLKYEADQVFKY